MMCLNFFIVYGWEKGGVAVCENRLSALTTWREAANGAAEAVGLASL